MYSILDYLFYYKNITIDEVHWNDVDNLLCAILAYLPMDSFFGPVKFPELYSRAQKVREKENTNGIAPTAYELLELIRESKRYKDLKAYNFVSYKNNEAQFGAVTFRIHGETIISFMGTDYSLIGWFENFRLSYEYPTKTHILAINYLKENIRLLENKNIYVVGHSKGGNLAMVSAMEASNYNFSRIKRVYNFDGPGLKKEEFESGKYKKLSKKLTNILPDGSVVGALLYNDNYTVVKSGNVAFNKHNPRFWNLFGECFIEARMSNVSKQLYESSTSGLDKVSPEQRRKAFEAIFESFEGEHSRDFNITLQSIIKAHKNFRNLEPEAAKSIDAIFDAIVKVQLFNKNKE